MLLVEVEAEEELCYGGDYNTEGLFELGDLACDGIANAVTRKALQTPSHTPTP